jgi:hypothetical protein
VGDVVEAVGRRRWAIAEGYLQEGGLAGEKTLATSVGRFLLERLRTWGVRRIYGYPGDGIDGIMGVFHDVEMDCAP